MKNISKLLVVIVLLGFSLKSCKNSKEDNKKTNTIVETEEKEVKTEQKTEVETVINANLASEEDLKGLGLSEDIVSSILEQRPFLVMNDLDVILESTNKEALYKKMFVPFNLNTTAEADFKMIPGVGDKMAHEFDEYRPYISVKQFKREIGKYVDDDEVNRYLNYVFVPVELNTATEEDIKALPGVGKRMTHEFEEYRPYSNLAQFRKEIGKYVNDKELKRLERLVYLKTE